MEKYLNPLPMDIASAPEGPVLRITPAEFGQDPLAASGFHVSGFLYLNAKGASTCLEIYPLAIHDGSGDGSRFKSAALYLADVYFQYNHSLKLPMDASGSLLLKHGEIPPGQYTLRLIQKKAGSGYLFLNAWFFDGEGNTAATVTGISMDTGSDDEISGTSVHCGLKDESLNRLRLRCRGLSIVELDSVAPFAHRALSVEEALRMEKMGEKRRRSFTGARLACKFLSRRLAGNDRLTPADSIVTISSSGSIPRCPLPDGTEPFRCTVSHDERFVVAAADEGPIGIDVEAISGRTSHLLPRFSSIVEQDLAARFPLGIAHASVRIWSIKEAAAKALNIPLPESWKRVCIGELGEHESIVCLDGNHIVAYHEMIDEHLITLAKFEKNPSPGRGGT